MIQTPKYPFHKSDFDAYIDSRAEQVVRRILKEARISPDLATTKPTPREKYVHRIGYRLSSPEEAVAKMYRWLWDNNKIICEEEIFVRHHLDDDVPEEKIKWPRPYNQLPFFIALLMEEKTIPKREDEIWVMTDAHYCREDGTAFTPNYLKNAFHNKYPCKRAREPYQELIELLKG